MKRFAPIAGVFALAMIVRLTVLAQISGDASINQLVGDARAYTQPKGRLSCWRVLRPRRQPEARDENLVGMCFLPVQCLRFGIPNEVSNDPNIVGQLHRSDFGRLLGKGDWGEF